MQLLDKLLNRKSINSLPPLEDPFILPTDVKDFKEWHIKVLRRLDNHKEKEKFTGIMTMEVDIPRFVQILQQLDLIDLHSYDESLYLLENETLKQILKNFNLKSTGKKQELVNRILTNISKSDVRTTKEYSDFYILTEKGRKLVDDSYNLFEQIHLAFFKEMTELIIKYKFDEAYRTICKLNAEKPVPPGLNCQWDKWYYSGITDSLLRVSTDSLKKSDNRKITAATLFGSYSGDSIRNITNMMQKTYLKDMEHHEIYNKLHTEQSLVSGRIDILSYNTAGISEYQFLAALDERTCPICGKLDGKIFALKDKKIGVNFPPMHDACRCTTTSALGLKCGIDRQRSAIDPATGKRIIVPGNMNYQEWKEKYYKQ